MPSLLSSDDKPSLPVIAIDGTFASGKGTLGRRLAAHFGFAYLDTGKLYRAAAARALDEHTDLDDGEACALIAANISPQDLDNPILVSGPVGAAASRLAVHPPVRAALFDFQRAFAAAPGNNAEGVPYAGAILDGRDIGTVICPDANVKIYVDADPNVRARRRHTELTGYGEDVTFEQVLAQLIERDTRDKSRKQAPLKPAKNAHLLDTTNLGIDAAFEAARRLVVAVLEKHV